MGRELAEKGSAEKERFYEFESGDKVVFVTSEDGTLKMKAIELVDEMVLLQARDQVGRFWNEQDRLPDNSEGATLIAGLKDTHQNPLRYQLVNSKNFHLYSDGTDGVANTVDDAWLVVTRVCQSVNEQQMASELGVAPSTNYTWLEKRKAQLSYQSQSEAERGESKMEDFLPKRNSIAKEEIAPQEFKSELSHKLGGDVTVKGAAYFWFFTQLMFGTAFFFMVVAYYYKPKTYIQGDDNEEAKPDHESDQAIE